MNQLEDISKELDINLLDLLQFESVSITNNGGANQHALIFNGYSGRLE